MSDHERPAELSSAVGESVAVDPCVSETRRRLNTLLRETFITIGADYDSASADLDAMERWPLAAVTDTGED
jgi:hypothetical protein